MTYLKTALIASAASALAISTASAGEKNWDKAKTEIKSETTVTTTMTENTDEAPDMLKAKHDHTIGEILQKDGELHTEADQKLLTHDGDKQTKAMIERLETDSQVADNAIAIPSTAGAVTTVSCPVGTTAQPDMTCLVTGDFDMERSAKLLKQDNEMRSEVAGAVEVTTTTETTTYEMSDDTMSPEMTYETIEYKGTLRPNTVVTENVQNDPNYGNWED